MTALTTAAVPRARGTGAALRPATHVLLGSMVVVDVLFVVGLVVPADDTTRFVDPWLSLGTQWIPVALFWLAVARTSLREPIVVLAAAGVTFSALGETYSVFARDADGYLPFPSTADATQLLFYVLMIAAVVMLGRRQLGRAERLANLEASVATVGAAAVVAVFLDPVFEQAFGIGTTPGVAIAFAYPLLILAMFGVLSGNTAVRTVRVGRRWWALIAGLEIYAAADVAYVVLAGRGLYSAGTLLDASWALALALVTWWGAGVTRMEKEHTPAPRDGLIFPVPALAVVAGLSVLVVGTILHLSVLPIALATLTVGLGAVPIIFRQGILGRMLAAEQEAVRRLTALDQDKTDMMMTLNHEFRTPLTSINGHVELLLDGGGGELPEKAVPMLKTIERNGERLQSLMDATLTVSRLGAAAAPVTRLPLDAVRVITRAVGNVEARATAARVRLRLECTESEFSVDGDDSLGEALVNVIDNAVKFSAADGEVTISVTRSPTENALIIQISDTGIGIPTGEIARLGTRFFRASNVQHAAIPGVGLGLSIAQQVIRAYGGSISIDSVLGNGTTATITLPAAARDGVTRRLRSR